MSIKLDKGGGDFLCLQSSHHSPHYSSDKREKIHLKAHSNIKTMPRMKNPTLWLLTRNPESLVAVQPQKGGGGGNFMSANATDCFRHQRWGIGLTIPVKWPFSADKYYRILKWEQLWQRSLSQGNLDPPFTTLMAHWIPLFIIMCDIERTSKAWNDTKTCSFVPGFLWYQLGCVSDFSIIFSTFIFRMNLLPNHDVCRLSSYSGNLIIL